MCMKCNGTGRVHSEIMRGVHSFSPCTCHHYMQQRQALELELADLRKRLAMLRAGLSAEGKAD
jgi:hypothetical protein